MLKNRDYTKPLLHKVINDLTLQFDNRKIFFNQAVAYYKTLDFIVDFKNNLKIGLSHYYLASDSDNVYAAGRLRVNHCGEIFYIDDKSGHYQPNKAEFKTGLNFVNQFVNIDNLLKSDIIETKWWPKYIVKTKNNSDSKDQSYKKFLIDIWSPENLHIVEEKLAINNFDPVKYLNLNRDVVSHIESFNISEDSEKYRLAVEHFINHGQFEDGRLLS